MRLFSFTHGYLEICCLVSKCSVLPRCLFPGALFIESRIALGLFLTIPFVCTFTCCQFLQTINGDTKGKKETQGTHPCVIPKILESLDSLPSLSTCWHLMFVLYFMSGCEEWWKLHLLQLLVRVTFKKFYWPFLRFLYQFCVFWHPLLYYCIVFFI